MEKGKELGNKYYSKEHYILPFKLKLYLEIVGIFLSSSYLTNI